MLYWRMTLDVVTIVTYTKSVIIWQPLSYNYNLYHYQNTNTILQQLLMSVYVILLVGEDQSKNGQSSVKIQLQHL